MKSLKNIDLSIGMNIQYMPGYMSVMLYIRLLYLSLPAWVVLPNQAQHTYILLKSWFSIFFFLLSISLHFERTIIRSYEDLANKEVN